MAQSRSFDLDNLFTYCDCFTDDLDLFPGKEETRKRKLILSPVTGAILH